MSQNLIFPINNVRITASWKTDSYLKRFGFVHYGMDMVSTTSDRTVYGMGNGEVLKAGNDSIMGNFMILKFKDAFNHKTMKAQDLVIRIWHLASIIAKTGSTFTPTTKIAVYGNTGKYTTGAHLHLEVDTDANPKYANWTPSLSGSTANFIGSKLGAHDRTMTNPMEWLCVKSSAPQNQNFSTTNDAYIRAEDKSPYYYPTQSATKTFEGIDISSYNGKIDFDKVKASGKEFVFVRIGHAGWNGQIYGNNLQDKNFHTNMKAAIASGLKVGVYLYSYCKDVASAKVAADEVISLLKDYDVSYPVAFDIEDTSDTGTRYDKMSKSLNTDICKTFMKTIKDAGYYPILYTYKYFADSYLNMNNLQDYDFWLAQYAPQPTYSGKFTIWQYKGDIKGYIGSCPGVNGNVDQNVSYVDYGSIIAEMKKKQEEANKPEEPVIPGTPKTLEERIAILEAKVASLESRLN